MEWYELWFLMRLDALVGTFFLGVAICSITGLFWLIQWLAEEGPFQSNTISGNCHSKKARMLIVIWFILYIISIVGLAVTPTTKQAAVIILGSKIASRENIDFASSETKEIYELVKQYLQNAIDEKHIKQ